MFQKEVKKKTSIYGIVAVLSAIILISMVYAFGTAPIIFPPSQTPAVSGMKTFSSINQLKNFLTANSQGSASYNGGPLDAKFFGMSATPTAVPASMSQGAFGASNTKDSSAPQIYWVSSDGTYSTTNIQVAGVDEADTVKTDGQYIYTIATTQNSCIYFWNGYSSQTNTENSVYIMNADPQNAKVVSKITLDNNTEPAGLFLSQDGTKLVVLASKYQMFNYCNGDAPAFSPSNMMLASYQSDVYTYINVYDVSDKASPVLTRNFTVSGSYFNSRMIGNYIYAVVSQPALIYNNVLTLPVVYEDKKQFDVAPSTVYYANMNQSSYFTFTSFYGIDAFDDSQQPTNMTVLMDGASTMYVSQSNLYITYPTWTEEGQYTSIYRVSINGLKLSFEAKGSVPGNILNQYAMDEYNGNFRVATNWNGETQLNNVYVLNLNLTIVGKLEGLAQGENLHSMRFMGDKCYLVTFKRTDPLFVIDLSPPTNPTVLGELKIPGYSDYLHPFDATHLIGLGKEAVDAEKSDFAYYQGLKLSLFDVSDVNNPAQLANFTIGDRGTNSAALNDPKAFLFDKAKGLLVIPVDLALVSEANKQMGNSAYGDLVWQGAYVFSLSYSGFTLKGTVTHLNSTLLNNPGKVTNSMDYYSSQNQWITRSLYIGNTLYTISNAEVKLNNLTDLSQTGEVILK